MSVNKSNIIQDGNLKFDHGHMRKRPSGRVYPLHDIGMPLLLGPYFAAAYGLSDRIPGLVPAWLLRKAKMNKWSLLKSFLSLLMIFMTGLLGCNIYEICHDLSQDKVKSFFWALLSVLSPPILSHSYFFFTEILSALVAVTIYKMIKIERPLSDWQITLIGFFTGCLFLIHVRNVGIIVVLVVLSLIRIAKDPNSRKWLTLFVLSFSVVMISRTILNYHMWGQWITTPHAPLTPSLDLFYQHKTIAIRFLGLTFDQEHGLLLYGPIYLFSIAGFILLYQKSKDTFYELLLLVFLYWFILSVPILNPHK